MKPLFGRFQHLVEDIFGLLNGKSLTCCSQINKLWNTNLEEYRLYLVKKFQKYLKNQSLQSTCSPNRILDLPWTASYAIENNLTVEQLPLKFLVQFLKIFCDSKLKVHEVNFRIISVKKTSVLFGIIIRNKPNGRVEDIMVVSQKISVSTSEASSTRESAINVTVCSFLSGFFFRPVSFCSLLTNGDNSAVKWCVL